MKYKIISNKMFIAPVKSINKQPGVLVSGGRVILVLIQSYPQIGMN
jgi:hypothetical protein